MKFTNKQEEAFKDCILNVSLSLEDAVDWIQRNLELEDVFKISDLEMWADTSGYIKEE